VWDKGFAGLRVHPERRTGILRTGNPQNPSLREQCIPIKEIPAEGIFYRTIALSVLIRKENHEEETYGTIEAPAAAFADTNRSGGGQDEMTPETPGAPGAYPLRMVYVYLTRDCNLACRHCWIAPKYQRSGVAADYLPLDFFTAILDEAQHLGAQAVKLTGGEPLLHPEIGTVISRVRDSGLRLTMETNGTLVTPRIAADIAAGKQPFVSVSLDGGDAAVHEGVRGVRGCFDAACNGITLLSDAGVAPQVIMTVMRANRDHVRYVVRLAESLGAGSVKFNMLQPTGRGEEIRRSGAALTAGEYLELFRWIEHHLTSTTPLRLYCDYPPAFRPLSRIFCRDGDGCGVCGIHGIIGVLSDGRYALCGIGETTPDLVLGSHPRDSLAAVWRDAPVLGAVRKGIPRNLKGICGECALNRLCLGNCVAQNYCRSSDLLAPFWFCEEAEKQGLFPESRRIEPARNGGADR